MPVVIDGTNGIDTPDLASTGPITGTTGTFSGGVSGTTGTFSGNVTLGSSVLATPTGSAPSYTCRAWVNFNGTGTVAIRASGNVSSITDFGTGDFGANFTTAMPDSNYAVVASFKNDTTLPTPTTQFDQTINAYSSSTTQAAVYTGYQNQIGSNRIDPVQVHVAIFR
jgi:hypothetical protein